MTDAVQRLSASLAGRYAVERELGVGGMAMVYLAHDVRHDRNVALKVLRPELSAILGADRFLHEIKTTANLQHPHILPLHDSGEADGLVYYVMPYVQGETLRDRLAREHQLPVDEAVRIAREVADALEYAHQHGIVHRDIKPENILLQGGHALVADFGIALAAARSDGGTRMTETGMSLGTPHYMAPEQAMGEREITPRADIYALGCVLYEMLLGEPPFTGPTAQAIVAKVMTEDPRPITMHRRSVPTHVEAAVLQSLEKLPADRMPTAAAFAAALSGATDTGWTRAREQAGARLVTRRSVALPWAVAIGAVLAAAGLGAKLGGRAASGRVVMTSIAIPSEVPPAAVRLSPDGSTLAFITGRGDRLSIYIRRLDELEARRLEGTDDAFTLSWSPDGQWLAYLVGTQPRKVPINGGASVAIPVQSGAQVAWIEWADAESFYVSTEAGLARLRSDGRLEYIYRPDSTEGARYSSTRGSFVALEQVLPDGRLLSRLWRTPPNGPILAVDPDDGRVDTLLDANAAWAGAADGMLLWTLADGTLYGAPFGSGERGLDKPGMPLGAVVLSVLGFTPPVSVAPGALAYAPTRSRALVRVDRLGRSTELLASDRTWHSPRVSPDGRRIALDFTDQQRDVWLFDVAESTLTRFGFDSSAHDPTWLPDGSGLAFASIRGSLISPFIRRFERRGVEALGMTGSQFSIHSITRDGRIGVGVAVNGGAFDIMAAGMDGSGFDSLIATQYNEGWPALSPDNRFLAYQSDESGRNEVYLVTWPALGNKVQVSQNGGAEPVWSRDGRELFYRAGGGAVPMLVSATIDAGGAPRVRSRTELFTIGSIEFATPHANYDVFPDGRSFVMVRQGRPGQLAEVVYLQNPAALVAQRTR